MNILEKFIYIFKKCIIILSGFEKLHLHKYATQLADDFNFELIEFKYPDFESLNNAIKNSKSNGIIIYGLTFPTDKLQFKPQFHISLSGNKTIIDDESQFSIYNQYVKENFVNKFKNIKVAEFNEEVYDDIYNMCIQYVMKKVYGDNYEKAQKKYIEDTETESETESETENEYENETITTADDSSIVSGGRKKNVIKGTRKILKKIPKKGSKKISKKGSMKGKGSNKGGAKKTSKPKKLKRVIGTRLVMNVIKL